MTLYAGPPAAAESLPGQVSGHAVDPPFRSSSVQVFAAFGDQRAEVALLLDLGENRDVARLELYGNLLLPPIEENGRPLGNFGLPHALAVAVVEEPWTEIDLHGLSHLSFWHGPLREVAHPRFTTLDLRALWGWTPIHLPATFGRYLVLLFSDLPRIWWRGPVVGVDIQRIVVYPFLEDVDHRPRVEYAPLASRQTHYTGSSAYWSRLGVDPPDPAAHQSIGYAEEADALCLPSALVGLPAQSAATGSALLYMSDLLSIEDHDRALLTLEATCDEIPVLDAVRLTFRLPRDLKSVYRGPEVLPDYLVSVYTTNDVEAAWSSDSGHPSWSRVLGDTLVRASVRNHEILTFAEPTWARWVQLRVRPMNPEGADLGSHSRLVLTGLDLLRCRDFWLAPEDGQDIHVENVLLRLRGPRLLDDYAYLDGEHGVGLVLEARDEDGRFEELRCYRTLVELLEDTHHRVFANHRRADKPVQRLHEITDSRSTSTSDGTSSSSADVETMAKPGHPHTVVTRSGSLTTYTKRPRDNLGGPPFSTLPAVDTTGITTSRRYGTATGDLEPMTFDLESLTPDGLVEGFASWAQEVADRGMPVSLGLSGNLGASIDLVAGGSAGIGANAGVQVGGGTTASETEGNQGSVVESETWTLSSYSRQDSKTISASQGSASVDTHDERDVVRNDQSDEVRKAGLEVRYGAVYEDIILVGIPVGRTLRAPRPRRPTGLGLAQQMPARPPGDAVRLRVDHLPPGVSLDVEFRGRVDPRRDDGE